MIKKYIAHICIEADTPLKVGSNSSNFLQDSPIQKDWNGLPMILGTSIAGVLRKDFGDDANALFGYEDKKHGKGSNAIFSNALLVDEKGEVNEGLLLEKSDFLKIFDTLPIREHTKIDHKGVTGSSKEYSKFDEEIVYKGTQFRFSIEIIEDEKAFFKILKLLQSNAFRLGGGTTKGFGKFKILEIKTLEVDTVDKLAEYSASLNNFMGTSIELDKVHSETHTTYTLSIKPEDFFMFGSGFGDKEADQTPVYEKVLDYKIAKLSDNKILIPASSIKGAISHRTAFYYNKNQKIYADNLKNDEYKKHVDENNKAVAAIFGHKKELSEDKNTELGQKGKILISDCFKKIENNHTKTFDHVAIDRFTGGAMQGALFQEKTISQRDNWEVEILLEHDIEKAFESAFEEALKDVCSGMLALGGATTKGHGVFCGSLRKNDLIIYEGECNA